MNQLSLYNDRLSREWPWYVIGHESCKKEQREWCADNIGKIEYDWSPRSESVAFKNKDDAVLFMMSWA